MVPSCCHRATSYEDKDPEEGEDEDEDEDEDEKEWGPYRYGLMVASASQPASQPVVLESQFAGTCMAVVVVVLYMLAGLLLVCGFVSVVHVVRPCHAASRLF